MVVHILFLPVSFHLPEVYFEAQGGGDACMQITDVLHCTAEANKHCNAIIVQF